MGFNVIMFLGSVREGRMVVRVATFLENVLRKRGHNVTVYDPAKMEFPLLKKPLHFHGPDEQPPEWLIHYNKQLQDADAFVVVSGEYNRCIPPPLANMMDHFPPATYKGKPCAIATYSMGPGGGSTAGMQLRYFLGELGMVTPQFMFNTPNVHEAFAEDGTPLEARRLSGAEKLFKELEWYAAALKQHRENFGPCP